jgi:hypothetical protein
MTASRRIRRSTSMQRMDPFVPTPPYGVSADPALGFHVRYLDLLVPTTPDGVAASPALGLGVQRMESHVPTPPCGVSADPALGFDVGCLDPLVPTPPDGVAAGPALSLGVPHLDLLVLTPVDGVEADPALGRGVSRLDPLVPCRPLASRRTRRSTSTCRAWTCSCPRCRPYRRGPGAWPRRAAFGRKPGLSREHQGPGTGVGPTAVAHKVPAPS